ncbi:uncharacterized protein [Desmodus rotundus]|uniref:uncharacterized protein n=1 Tax=Desmodus rotundus TaxID=9430 RepID=UPI002380E6BB|nr:uncharacterized protein LOC123478992 isoform X2 [Desmodus rotundus]
MNHMSQLLPTSAFGDRDGSPQPPVPWCIMTHSRVPEPYQGGDLRRRQERPESRLRLLPDSPTSCPGVHPRCSVAPAVCLWPLLSPISCQLLLVSVGSTSAERKPPLRQRGSLTQNPENGPICHLLLGPASKLPRTW